MNTSRSLCRTDPVAAVPRSRGSSDTQSPTLVSRRGGGNDNSGEVRSDNAPTPTVANRSLGAPPEIIQASPDVPAAIGFAITDGADAFGYYAALVGNEETTDSNEYV